MNKQNINSIQQISRNLYAQWIKAWVHGGGARTLLSQSLNLALKRLRPPLGHKIRLLSLGPNQVELFIPQQKWQNSESDEMLVIAARMSFSWLIHKNILDHNMDMQFKEYHIQRLQNFDHENIYVRQQILSSDLELVRLDLNHQRKSQVLGSVLFFTASDILVAQIDATCEIVPKSEISWGASHVSHDGH